MANTVDELNRLRKFLFPPTRLVAATRGADGGVDFTARDAGGSTTTLHMETDTVRDIMPIIRNDLVPATAIAVSNNDQVALGNLQSIARAVGAASDIVGPPSRVEQAELNRLRAFLFPPNRSVSVSRTAEGGIDFVARDAGGSSTTMHFEAASVRGLLPIVKNDLVPQRGIAEGNRTRLANLDTIEKAFDAADQIVNGTAARPTVPSAAEMGESLNMTPAAAASDARSSTRGR